MSHEHLLAPISVRGLTLRNRVLFPGMATVYVDEKGHVSQRLIDYHVARARGGNGLNVTEACCVHTPTALPYFLSIHSDEFVPGLKQLTSAIHAAGGKACVQLWQAGLITLFVAPEVPLVFPSDQMGPPGASLELIHECERAFGEAAARAVEAGFDCVEFHCAHNYSPHSFLSAYFNHRTDEYGGSFENRMRYPLECLRSIRRSIPESVPALIRVSAIDDFLEGGMTIEDMIAFLKRAKEVGADIVDVSRGNVVSPALIYEVPPIDIPRGFNVENAAAIRKGTGMVTCAVGRINDPDQAEEIIASGKADMVAIGRGQIADPEFVNKVRAGRAADITKCIACDQGCYDRVNDPEHRGISCLQNPAVGREFQFAVKKAARPKTVLVAGGGMGGMLAAAMLQERGHRPILCEATGALGGQFVLAGLAPRKGEMRDAALARAQQLQRAGVDIRLNTRVDAALVEKVKPDAVIVAVGGEPIRFRVPGIDGPNVTDAVTVLTGNAKVKGQVAVIGGGLVGIEVAEYLAEVQPGVTGVTIVEMLGTCGADLGMLRKQSVDENIAKHNICALTDTKCESIRPGAVVAQAGGAPKEIPADYVVIAVGSRAVDHAALDAACERLGIPYYVIGDARQARRAIDATAEAAEAVLAIHNS